MNVNTAENVANITRQRKNAIDEIDGHIWRRINSLRSGPEDIQYRLCIGSEYLDNSKTCCTLQLGQIVAAFPDFVHRPQLDDLRYMSLNEIRDGLSELDRRSWHAPLGLEWMRAHENCNTLESLKGDIIDIIDKIPGISLEDIVPASEISPFNPLATT